MQEAPARLVQRLYETFARQDTEGALALIDPEIVIEYSGAEVEIRIGQVWTVQGGRAVRWEIYPDFEQAHSAVGLP